MDLVQGICSFFGATSFVAVMMTCRYRQLWLPTLGVGITAAGILLYFPIWTILLPALGLEPVDGFALIAGFMALTLILGSLHLCFFVPIVAALVDPKRAEARNQ